MGAQPALASDQRNLSHLKLIRTGPLDNQRIPRPDRRKHAPTRSCKSKAAVRTQNLAREITLHSGGSIRLEAVDLPHDTFVFWPQPLWEEIILPQVRADVTKTCS